jgi:hypothetical protein
LLITTKDDCLSSNQKSVTSEQHRTLYTPQYCL